MLPAWPWLLRVVGARIRPLFTCRRRRGLLRLREGLTSWERIPLAYGLGTTALGVATLLAGRLGMIAPWPGVNRGTEWFRLRDGKIVGHWGLNDALTLMMQLGAIQPPA